MIVAVLSGESEVSSNNSEITQKRDRGKKEAIVYGQIATNHASNTFHVLELAIVPPKYDICLFIYLFLSFRNIIQVFI